MFRVNGSLRATWTRAAGRTSRCTQITRRVHIFLATPRPVWSSCEHVQRGTCASVMLPLPPERTTSPRPWPSPVPRPSRFATGTNHRQLYVSPRVSFWTSCSATNGTNQSPDWAKREGILPPALFIAALIRPRPDIPRGVGMSVAVARHADLSRVQNSHTLDRLRGRIGRGYERSGPSSSVARRVSKDDIGPDAIGAIIEPRPCQAPRRQCHPTQQWTTERNVEHGCRRVAQYSRSASNTRRRNSTIVHTSGGESRK